MKLQKQKSGFSQISNILLCDPNISAKAKGIYAYLYSKPDDWDFSVERIVRDFQDGEKALYTGVKELEDAGYVRRSRQGDGKMAYYIFIEPQVEENPTAENRQEDTEPTAENVKQPKGLPAETGGIYNIENTTNTEIEEIKNIPAKNEKIYSCPIFINFWKLYPRKIDKPKAWAAWKKLSPAGRESAFEGLKAWTKLWDKFKDDEKAYIIYPERFLKYERYSDETIRTDLANKLKALQVPGSANNKTAAEIQKAKDMEITFQKKLQENEELEKRNKEEARKVEEEAIRYFKSLPQQDQDALRKKAEDSLMAVSAIANTREKYPEQFEKMKKAKII